MEYNSATHTQKEWNNTICSNMDATADYHSKWNKSERERQIPYDVAYMWNLKHGTNEPMKQKQTERADLWLPRGGRWVRGGLGVWG